jgi:hypothetical protein
MHKKRRVPKACSSSQESVEAASIRAPENFIPIGTVYTRPGPSPCDLHKAAGSVPVEKEVENRLVSVSRTKALVGCGLPPRLLRRDGPSTGEQYGGPQVL